MGDHILSSDDFKNDKAPIRNYDVIQKISRGAFGTIYLCSKIDDPSEIYAMKVVRKKDVIDKNKINNVYGEREILSSVECPFIVSLFNFIQTENYVCFVMEYMNGGDLKNMILILKGFNDYMTAFYIAECALAIDYLHRQNIIHRDIKPDNMLVDRYGHMKLTDFGLSETAKFVRLAVADAVYTPRGRQKLRRTPRLKRTFSSGIHFNKVSDQDTFEESRLFRTSSQQKRQEDSYRNDCVRRPPEKQLSDCSIVLSQSTENSNVSSISLMSHITCNDISSDCSIALSQQSVDEPCFHPASNTTPERLRMDSASTTSDNHEHSSSNSTIVVTGRSGSDLSDDPECGRGLGCRLRRNIRRRSLHQSLRNFCNSSFSTATGSLNIFKRQSASLSPDMSRCGLAASRYRRGSWRSGRSRRTAWSYETVDRNIVNDDDDGDDQELPGQRQHASVSNDDDDYRNDEETKVYGELFVPEAMIKSGKQHTQSVNYSKRKDYELSLSGNRERSVQGIVCNQLKEVGDAGNKFIVQKLTTKSITLKKRTASNTQCPMLHGHSINDNDKGVRGTPDYFAPEMILHSIHTRGVDWWALGCCMFEFTYGCPPFWDQTIEDVLDNIVNYRVAFDESVDETTNVAIQRLLAVNPSSRAELEDLKRLPFFRSINFSDMKSMQPPYIPTTKQPCDISNFEAVNKVRQFDPFEDECDQ